MKKLLWRYDMVKTWAVHGAWNLAVAGGVSFRRTFNVVVWFFAKAVPLLLAVLIGLRLGLEFVLRKLNALNHIEGMVYADWFQLSFAVTVALLFFTATTNWVLRRTTYD